MLTNQQILEMTNHLSDLTDKDEIRWQKFFFNGHNTHHKFWELAVEWLSGEQPEIVINNSKIRGHGYGIEGLLEAIDKQYKRHKIYQYSDESQREDTLMEERKKIDEAQRAARLEKEVGNILAEKKLQEEEKEKNARQ